MGQEDLPAVPETPAQQARYDRVIAVATDVLSAGGLEAVQMKDLAQRAGVSLATLYRYFPSKDYLLLAVALASYQAALRKVKKSDAGQSNGGSPAGSSSRASAAPSALNRTKAPFRGRSSTPIACRWALMDRA